MSAQVFVAASFMYDMVATAPRLPAPGETLIGTAFATYVGGKGFNQAVAAARAGAGTAVLGRIGQDRYGEEFRTFLAAEGIDASYLIADAETGTGVGLPVVDSHGQNAIIVVPRANEAVSVRDVETARAAIEAAKILLLQLELPLRATTRAAQIAAGAGVQVILNPAPFAEVPAELAGCIDVLVPNEVELAQLVPGAPDLVTAAAQLQADWRCAVVVTRGGEGALVLDADAAPVAIGGVAVAVTDTIGAGDAFCGNLGARLAAGDSLVQAARYANFAAALSVTRSGGAPSTPTADETDVFVTRS